MPRSSVRRIGGSRHRLLPLWAPIPLLALVVGIFYLVFPGDELTERVRDDSPDQTSVAYLRAQTSHKGRAEDRLALARQQAQLGDLNKAIASLIPLIESGDRLAHWQLLEIHRQQFFGTDSDRRQALRQQLLIGIRDHLNLDPPISEMERLAEWALELGEHRLAADIYHQLVERSLDPQAAWRSLLFASSITSNAQAPKPVEYALKAIDALIAGDEGDEALTRLKGYLERFPDSRTLLNRGVEIALARNQTALARRWAERHMTLAGESEPLLKRQIDLALADGDASAARLWGRRLLALRRGEGTAPEAAVKHQLQLEIGANDTAAARELGSKLLADDPQNPELLKRQIDLELAHGDADGARQLGRRLLALTPDDPTQIDQQIRREQAAGDTTMARELGRRYLKLRPDDPKALDRQIELALADGDPAAARQWGRQRLTLKEFSGQADDIVIRHQLALEIGANDTAAARDLGRRLLTESPHDAVLLQRQIKLELAHGDSTAARELGRQLLAQTPDDPDRIRAQIDLELATGNAIEARDLGRRLLDLGHRDTETITDQIRYELAAGDSSAASALGREYLVLNPDDYRALKRQIELELATGATTKARDVGRRLQSMNQEDAEHLRRQIELEMAAADLAGALAASRQLAIVESGNAEVQIQLARLLEWNNRPREALKQWVHSVDRWPDPEHRNHTINLAEQLYEVDVVARLLTESARDGQLTDPVLDRWIDAIEGLGEPHLAVDQLQNYLARQPRHRHAWNRLIELWQSLGDLKSAANVFDRMSRIFEPTVDTVVERALMDWRRFDSTAALSALGRYRHLAADHVPYWQTLAAVAWAHGDENQALKAYRKLAALGKTDPITVDRLSQLIRVQSDPVEGLTLAREAWRDSRASGFWLMAMDAALAQRETGIAHSLLDELDKAASVNLETTARYWQIRAALAELDRDYSAAAKHYGRVLELAPQDSGSIAGLLWLTINAENKAQLDILLSRWLPEASTRPALWAPIAAGLRMLDRSEESIPWFRREAERNPGDMIWLLSYADALNAAGRKKNAWWLRRYVLREHRSTALEALNRRRIDDPEPLRRMAELIRDQTSDQSGEHLVSALLQRRTDDPLLHEFQIAWALAANRYSLARRWAFRAHLKRLQLPAWQNLALALHADDHESIDRILASDAILLVSDRVEALRRVGRQDEALRTAKAAFRDGLTDNVHHSLARQSSELLPQVPNGWAVSLEQDDRGSLIIDSAIAKAAWSRGPDTWQLETGHFQLKSDGARLVLDSVGAEKELSLLWRRRYPRAESRIQLASNLRMDKDIYRLNVGYTRRLYSWLSSDLELALNEAGDESAGFRVAGLRDRFTLGLSGDITPREYVLGNLSLREYRSRHGADLGNGVATNIGAGHRIWLRNPELRIGLNASWSRNRITSNLPADIANIFPAGTGTDALLASRSREIGISAAIEKGIIRGIGNTGSSPRYLLELGSGWADPDWKQGFRLRFGLSSRVLGGDDLSFWGGYSEGIGGVDSDDTIELGIQYSKHFD